MKSVKTKKKTRAQRLKQEHNFNVIGNVWWVSFLLIWGAVIAVHLTGSVEIHLVSSILSVVYLAVLWRLLIRIRPRGWLRKAYSADWKWKPFWWPLFTVFCILAIFTVVYLPALPPICQCLPDLKPPNNTLELVFNTASSPLFGFVALFSVITNFLVIFITIYIYFVGIFKKRRI